MQWTITQLAIRSVAATASVSRSAAGEGERMSAPDTNCSRRQYATKVELTPVLPPSQRAAAGHYSEPMLFDG
jgi:hypothetical protein